MRKQKVFLTVLLGGMVMTVGGCVVLLVGAGAAGTVAYARGDLAAVESKGLDAVYAAAEKAVSELELNVVSKRKDKLMGEIVARDAEYKKITIKLKATAEQTTKISIRIGVFGDEIRSRLIYQKIQDNLK